jgi:hypothetical protein
MQNSLEENNITTVLSLHYLPSIDWFATLLHSNQVVLDIHEHYVKQSGRNRCSILAANGVQHLIIPVKKTAYKQTIKECMPQNDFAWQKQHWQSICSAYGSSPYFFHYRHLFEPLYHQQADSLYAFNRQLLEVCFSILKHVPDYIYSQAYIAVNDLIKDCRSQEATEYEVVSYLQVFADRHAFTPNLSILDLIFNQGPDAIGYLKRLEKKSEKI